MPNENLRDLLDEFIYLKALYEQTKNENDAIKCNKLREKLQLLIYDRIKAMPAEEFKQLVQILKNKGLIIPDSISKDDLLPVFMDINSISRQKKQLNDEQQQEKRVTIKNLGECKDDIIKIMGGNYSSTSISFYNIQVGQVIFKWSSSAIELLDDLVKNFGYKSGLNKNSEIVLSDSEVKQLISNLKRESDRLPVMNETLEENFIKLKEKVLYVARSNKEYYSESNFECYNFDDIKRALESEFIDLDGKPMSNSELLQLIKKCNNLEEIKNTVSQYNGNTYNENRVKDRCTRFLSSLRDRNENLTCLFMQFISEYVYTYSIYLGNTTSILRTYINCMEESKDKCECFTKMTQQVLELARVKKEDLKILDYIIQILENSIRKQNNITDNSKDTESEFVRGRIMDNMGEFFRLEADRLELQDSDVIHRKK